VGCMCLYQANDRREGEVSSLPYVRSFSTRFLLPTISHYVPRLLSGSSPQQLLCNACGLLLVNHAFPMNLVDHEPETYVKAPRRVRATWRDNQERLRIMTTGARRRVDSRDDINLPEGRKGQRMKAGTSSDTKLGAFSTTKRTHCQFADIPLWRRDFEGQPHATPAVYSTSVIRPSASRWAMSVVSV
jgi:hypothetical protein